MSSVSIVSDVTADPPTSRQRASALQGRDAAVRRTSPCDSLQLARQQAVRLSTLSQTYPVVPAVTWQSLPLPEDCAHGGRTQPMSLLLTVQAARAGSAGRGARGLAATLGHVRRGQGQYRLAAGSPGA